jgi:cyclopropane-fatty-acyl-phospholipid synthase
MAARDELAALLRAADVEIDGGDPWDIRVHDERFHARVLAHGSLGAGEAYMDGWWDVPRLDEFFARVHAARLERRLMRPAMLGQVVPSRIGNPQGREVSRRVARRYYDLSNDLYVAMLGATMQYTCAYYGADGADLTLDEALRRKLDRIARKPHLQPGMTVLELGGGFGGPWSARRRRSTRPNGRWEPGRRRFTRRCGEAAEGVADQIERRTCAARTAAG